MKGAVFLFQKKRERDCERERERGSVNYHDTKGTEPANWFEDQYLRGREKGREEAHKRRDKKKPHRGRLIQRLKCKFNTQMK